MPPKKNVYYAIKRGYRTGIFNTWVECEELVKGFPNPKYKKFNNTTDAEFFLYGTNKELDITTKSELTRGIRFNKFDLNNYPNTPKDWNRWEKTTYIFTDGSGKNNKTRVGVYFGKNSLNISETISNSTNNRCELLAIMYAFKLILKFKAEILGSADIENIIVVSDSEYCIKSITEWMLNWANNSWKTANNKPVLNADMFKEIVLLKAKLNVHKIPWKLEHQNSHQSPPLGNDFGMFMWSGNQIADYLAKDEV